jgi:CTP-dependent riboflavin kinase
MSSLVRYIGGKVVLSEPGKPRRTAGQFSTLILENQDVFREYFGVDLYPGSLNVDVGFVGLHEELDRGQPKPSFAIPRSELIGMPGYLGDGQAWRCDLLVNETQQEHACWLFRRIGSSVPPSHIEILSPLGLVEEFALRHGTPVTVKIHASR